MPRSWRRVRACVAVLCIWLISATISELEGKTTIAAFRALVIYSFALSFVVTAPIALVSARLISDKLHDRDVTAVPAIMLAAFGFSAVIIVVVGTLLFGVALDLDAPATVAAVANCALIALVWIGCLFCSVTRDYNSVTGFFAPGMLVAVVAVTVGYNVRPDLATMLWGFSLGLGVTLFGLLARIIATFPFAVRDIETPALRCAAPPSATGRSRSADCSARSEPGSTNGSSGCRRSARTIQNGLLHAPLYDSAMFVSYLVVVPAYAAFVVHLEVKFFRNYRLFYSSILEHATLAQIRAHGRRLRDETIASLSGITVPQLAICALVALSAPAVIDAARHAVPAGRHASARRDRRGVPVSVRHLLVADALFRPPHGVPRAADLFPRAQRRFDRRTVAARGRTISGWASSPRRRSRR